MSVERLKRESLRWLIQAEDDLEASEALQAAQKFAQASFFAQQAGEKALKAYWIRQDLDPWGHSLGRLVKDLPPAARLGLEGLLDTALALDKLYIPTRYPDALADLTPAEAYTRAEAATAAGHARRVIEVVRSHLGHEPAPD